MQRRLLTDGAGRFHFPVLPPGKYAVRVVGAGFAPVEIRDPELNVNDHLAYRVGGTRSMQLGLRLQS